MKNLFMLFSFFCPWSLKRWLLIKIFGFQIHPSARIGWAWVMPRMLILEENSRIDHLTVCKGLDLLHLKKEAYLGRLNWVTAYPSDGGRHFLHIRNRRPELVIDQHAAITNRHLIDCTEAVHIGAYTTFAGFRSQILTHSIDLAENYQDASPVRIGKYCFVGTDCVLLGGSGLPDFSILAAKSLLNASFQTPYQLYGGVPARILKSLPENSKYFMRQRGFVD